MKALHFASKNSKVVSAEFLEAITKIPDLSLEVVHDWECLPKEEILGLMRAHDILILSRSPKVPDELADDPGRMKYICYLHGTMRAAIGLPIIRSNIVVTNWGNRAGQQLAVDSFVLLLAVFKDLPKRIQAVRNGGGQGIVSMGDNISNLKIGIYGFGYSGRRFAELLLPFGCPIKVFDPYVENVPDNCEIVSSLDDLFSQSQAVVIHAGLTEETTNSVNKARLSMLPDQGILINTARGAIVEQEALFDELRNGRLRAGLDVLWPDRLEENHEARQWENLIWTCHQFSGSAWPSEGLEGRLRPAQIFLKNIEAFVRGEPVEFAIDETRYQRMT